MHRLNMHFWLRQMTPFLFCLVLVLGHLVPYHFLPYYPYSIQWVFIPIFYFAIYNPKCLSSWAVFLLGVISEMLIQSPMGVTTFCFVLLFFMANFLRRYLLELTFGRLWIVFAAMLLVVEIVNYLFVAMMAPTPVAFLPVLVEFWVLILLYPFIMRLCAHFDKKVREAAL